MTVFFDLDGTLLDDDAALRAGALALLRRHYAVFDLPDDVFVRQWKDVAATHWRRYEKREVTFAEQRRARVIDVFGAAGRALSAADADDIFQAYVRDYERNWRLFPDVLPCLDALDGRPRGVISNGDTAQQRKKLERTGLLRRFVTVTISGEVGVAKPALAIFLEACRRTGRPPHRCVYVWDRLATDALASEAAGMRGVWLHRAPDGDAPAGVIMMRSLGELAGIIDRIV